MDALLTVIPTGRSVTLSGSPILSTPAPDWFVPSYEAYIRKDLTINSGATATLGMDNALRRLDSSGNNITALTVNGTFNTGAYSQIVSTLSGAGTINLNTNGNLTVGENNAASTFSGSTAGNGDLKKVGTNVLTLSGAIGHTGNTVVQAGTVEFAQANGTRTVNSPISGAGNVAKSGAGTTELSGNNTYTGTTTVTAGTLRAGSNTAFGTNSAVTVNSGATLDLNGFNVEIGSLTGVGTPQTGYGTVTGNGTLTVGGDNTTTTYSGTIGTSRFTKIGTGVLTVQGISSADTRINDGILVLSGVGAGVALGEVRIGASGRLAIDAQASPVTIQSSVTGAAGSRFGGLIGTATSVTVSGSGFNHQGQFDVWNHTFTISNAVANLGGRTELEGGTLNATNGVTLGTSGHLFGRGTVSGKFTGVSGSQITATFGNLTVGKNVVGGFVHNGELTTGTNTVTVLSTNRATLGTVTTLGSGGTAGTLTVTNGAVVDFGRAIQGHGTINSTNTLAKAMIINGDVYGTSNTERITFTGYVKGVGTFENTTFTGTFAPGLSPTITYTNNATFTGTSILEMELGGTTPGTQHDKLIDSGLLTLGGTLKVIYLSGYTPTGSEVFDILDWQTTTGTFDAIDFSQAQAPLGYEWNTSNLYSEGTLSFTPVPEPGAVLLVGGLAAAGAWGWRRWRRVKSTQTAV